MQTLIRETNKNQKRKPWKRKARASSQVVAVVGTRETEEVVACNPQAFLPRARPPITLVTSRSQGYLEQHPRQMKEEPESHSVLNDQKDHVKEQREPIWDSECKCQKWKDSELCRCPHLTTPHPGRQAATRYSEKLAERKTEVFNLSVFNPSPFGFILFYLRTSFILWKEHR